jgi:hypothetical protein
MALTESRCSTSVTGDPRLSGGNYGIAQTK